MALTSRFALSGPWQGPAYLGFITAWALGTYFFQRPVRRIIARWHISARKIWGSAGLVLGYLWLTQMPGAFDYRQLVFAVVAGAGGGVIQYFFVRQVRRTRRAGGELLRWWGLAAISFWVIHPYATPYLVGGGDAHHYAQQLADAREQMQAGHIELYVGQSAYAFNGDIHPLRTAPYFSYVGGALSLLGGDALPPTAAQNLLIVLSFGAVVAGLYLLLTRLRPRAAWAAGVLAAACATSPGILALVYSGDMIASWLALPWLPLVFYAVIRLGETKTPVPALCVLSGALAMMWLAHAPVAFWTTLLVMLSQGARLCVAPDRGRAFGLLCASGALFLMLCGFVFISVWSLQLPNDPNLISFVRKGGMLEILKTGWEGLGRPIDPAGADLLRNLKLSPALGLAALLSLVSMRWHRGNHYALIFGAIGLLALLYPSANVAGRIWAIMPEAVISASDKWPMQRIYPILSVLVPFLALLAWPRELSRRSQIIALGLLLALSLATAYSLYDTRKFIARGYAITSSPEMSQRRMRPENVVLSRYSYEYYGRLPRAFTNGTVSPWMQKRLLNRGTLTPIDLNLLAVDPPATPAQPGLPKPVIRTRHRFVATDYGGYYSPPLRLEPNQVYFARFLFAQKNAQGTLQLLGHHIYREYPLPMSGQDHAFGMGALQRNGFSLWTTAKTSDQVEMRFYNTPDQPAPENLGDVDLIVVNPLQLPLRMDSLHPYKITVQTKTDSWLETPKLFLPGYAAEINGRSVPVERSPDGLVMIAVPAGQHQVSLNYVASPVLRASFWLMIFSGFGLLLFVFCRHRWPAAGDAAFLKFGRLATVPLILGTLFFAASQTRANLPLITPPALASSPVEIKFTLPVGRNGTWETLWDFDHGGVSWTIHCYYENGQNLRVALSHGSKLYAVSEAFQINYLRRHRMIATLTPALEGQAPQLKIWVNQRLVLRPQLNPYPGSLHGTELATTRFNGRIFHIGPSEGPIE